MDESRNLEHDMLPHRKPVQLAEHRRSGETLCHSRPDLEDQRQCALSLWFKFCSGGSRVEPVRDVRFFVVADDEDLVELVENNQQL